MAGLIFGLIMFGVLAAAAFCRAAGSTSLFEERVIYAKLVEHAGVPADEVDKCMLWALGEGWQAAALNLTDDRWNKLHSDIFIMHGTDSVLDTMLKIGRAYLAHRQSGNL